MCFSCNWVTPASSCSLSNTTMPYIVCSRHRVTCDDSPMRHSWKSLEKDLLVTKKSRQAMNLSLYIYLHLLSVFNVSMPKLKARTVIFYMLNCIPHDGLLLTENGNGQASHWPSLLDETRFSVFKQYLETWTKWPTFSGDTSKCILFVCLYVCFCCCYFT